MPVVFALDIGEEITQIELDTAPSFATLKAMSKLGKEVVKGLRPCGGVFEVDDKS